MKTEQESVVSVRNFGPLENWKDLVLSVPGLPPVAKQFLKNELGLGGMEVSLNHFAPGDTMPFTHRHRENEELYLFLTGRGEFAADDERIPIESGTCIRCAPETKRCWRNSGDSPMTFLCIQAPAKGMPEVSGIDDGEVVGRAPEDFR